MSVFLLLHPASPTVAHTVTVKSLAFSSHQGGRVWTVFSTIFHLQASQREAKCMTLYVWLLVSTHHVDWEGEYLCLGPSGLAVQQNRLSLGMVSDGSSSLLRTVDQAVCPCGTGWALGIQQHCTAMRFSLHCLTSRQASAAGNGHCPDSALHMTRTWAWPTWILADNVSCLTAAAELARSKLFTDSAHISGWCKSPVLTVPC